MSRSIHTTHGEVEREKRCSYSSREVGVQRLVEVRRALRKKQRIKQRSRAARREARTLDLPPVAARDIPIEVVDAGPWIHYPASPDDVRAVLERLPAGTLTGLACIRLALGAEYQEEGLTAKERREEERDPWLGRVSREILPGVYSGCVLGTYTDDAARIELYAHVYDPGLPDRARWECFLRLRMLATLLHEVAHFEDFRLRTARGRWRADDERKMEAHAEATAVRWVREIAVPWCEQTYPADVRELRQWLIHHGGTDVALELLVSNGSWNAEGKWEAAILGGGEAALEELARGLHAGDEPSACRLEFANNLHYGRLYEEALRVLERILADEPASLQALTLKADIHEHREEHAQAEALARRVIEQDPASIDAWKILADIHEARADWERLCDAAGRGDSLATTPPRHVSFREQLGRALLELGRDAELARVLEGMGLTPFGVTAAKALRALQLLRRGSLQEALEAAQEALADAGPPRRYFPRRYRAMLEAVRFEAAHRLGQPSLAGRLERRTIEILELVHLGPWARRLASEFVQGKVW